MKPTLGQRVRVRKHLFRDDTIWTPRDLPKPVEGIVTARRSRNNGLWDSEYDEWSGRNNSWYEIREVFDCYDVTFDLRRKPLIVLPEWLEEI